MKNKIETSGDALTFQLQGLYYTEERIKEEFGKCARKIHASPLKEEVKKYRLTAEDKLLKLERMFNYLMHEPLSRKNGVIDAMMEEIHLLLSRVSSVDLQNSLMVDCFQHINRFKSSNYVASKKLATSIGLNKVSDLLQEIIEWELETGDAINSLINKESEKQRVASLQPSE